MPATGTTRVRRGPQGDIDGLVGRLAHASLDVTGNIPLVLVLFTLYFFAACARIRCRPY